MNLLFVLDEGGFKNLFTNFSKLSDFTDNFSFSDKAAAAAIPYIFDFQ